MKESVSVSASCAWLHAWLRVIAAACESLRRASLRRESGTRARTCAKSARPPCAAADDARAANAVSRKSSTWSAPRRSVPTVSPMSLDTVHLAQLLRVIALACTSGGCVRLSES